MRPQVGVIMGSVSDWETMKYTCEVLEQLHIPFEKRVVSAHRTPDLIPDEYFDNDEYYLLNTILNVCKERLEELEDYDVEEIDMVEEFIEHLLEDLEELEEEDN